MVEDLKKKRSNKGLTQRDMGKLLGCSEQWYNEIENGKRSPSVRLAKEIGRILDVEWADFFKEKIN